MAEEVLTVVAWVVFVWCLWLFAESAPAQEVDTVQVSWDRPTERENGDPMPAEEILFYELHVNQVPVYEGEIVKYDISADRTSHQIQVLANECFTFTMYAAATGTPSCKPEQQYLLSAPSSVVTHCSGGGSFLDPPYPPREFM